MAKEIIICTKYMVHKAIDKCGTTSIQGRFW